MTEGVRKIDERVLISGRSLLVTDLAVNAGSVPEGTLQIDPDTGGLKVKTRGATEWSQLTPKNLLLAKSITSAFIGDRAITSDKIAVSGIIEENIKDLEITGAKLATGAVTETKIADGVVSGAKLKALSVTGDKVADNTITGAKLADYSITNTKLDTNSVSTLKIQDLAVTSAKIGDGQVSATKYADGSIATAKLQDGSVSAVKLATGAVTDVKILDGAVTTNKLADNGITAAKLGVDSVTTVKIQASAVTNAKLADLSITTAKLVDGAVTNAKIASGTIAFDRLDASTQSTINSALRVSGGQLTVGGNLQVNGWINATGNITGARVYNAVYNDLAEAFEPGADALEEGDIVEIDEIGKVFHARSGSRAVIGVVSNRFATLFGAEPSEIESGEKVAVGLVGRVPIKVVGTVHLGDSIVAAGGGFGVVDNLAPRHLVVGKAIESKYSQGIGKVMCLISPAV